MFPIYLCILFRNAFTSDEIKSSAVKESHRIEFIDQRFGNILPSSGFR